MPGRQLHRLSALRVAKEIAPGHCADDGGLYPQTADSDARSWVFRFRLGGRMREMRLGPETGRGVPTDYVGHLDFVLPRSKKRQDVKHHPAPPWEEGSSRLSGIP